MNLHVLPAGPIQTNAYLIAAPERGEAILIDAPADVWTQVAPLLEKHKARLTELWITHGHWDHMQGAAEVVRQSGAKARGHAADKVLFETPEVMQPMMQRFLGIDEDLEPVPIDEWVTHGQQLDALGVRAEVRHVPGHCPGNVLFYFPNQKVVFVGDTLFNGAIGRTDLPWGDQAELERSIREQIYTLPGETAVYPGHGLRTTVARERAGNPYVRG